MDFGVRFSPTLDEVTVENDKAEACGGKGKNHIRLRTVSSEFDGEGDHLVARQDLE